MMTRVRVVLFGCMLVAGCVDEVDLGRDDGELARERWDPQSDRLLGAQLREWDTAFAASASLVRTDARGFVTPPPAGGYLALSGLTRDAGAALDLRVYGTGASDVAGRPLYRVMARPAGVGDFKDYCGSSTAYAYALQGSFDPNGAYRPRNGLSFACPTGAAHKAVRWNLALGSLHPTNERPANPDGRRQAAGTSMARADFCGDGRPHTIAGTPIAFDDEAGYASAYVSVSGTLPDDPSGFLFEAAWIADGTEQTGFRGRALCISKWRWQALAPTECGNVVPDPRVNAAAKFCDDYPGVATGDLSALTSLGALTFSYSTRRDVGLWAWYDPATARYLTTEEGEHQRSCPPQFGTSCNKAASFRGGIRKDGDIDGVLGPDPDVVALSLYRNRYASPSQYRTTTATFGWLSVWTRERVVGYLFRGAPSATVPGVRLYEYAAGGQYRLFREDEAIPSGWTATRLDAGTPVAEGYALR